MWKWLESVDLREPGLIDLDGFILLISLLLRSKQIHIFVLIMSKMHRYVHLCCFFQPFGSLFGSLDHLQNNVGKSSSQCSFSSPVSYAIGYLFYQSAVTQTMSQASAGSCAREKFQSSTLTPFSFGLSLFDPVLALAFESFDFFFLLTSYVACSLLIAIMLCAFLPTAPNLPFSGHNKHAGKQWQATFTIRSLFIFLLNLLCKHDLVSRFKRTRTCIYLEELRNHKIYLYVSLTFAC